MTPYTEAALDYLGAGWSPIPLPTLEKSPPPDGLTGARGRYVQLAEVRGWVSGRRARAGNLSFPPGNIALRLPRNVLGIDLDMYGSKVGARSMREAVKKFGPLPDTWFSSARTDGSGIAFYTIPEGLAWPGQVGPGIETIRWDHRFAIVAPSLHPELRAPYRWRAPSGGWVDDEIPSPGDLQRLPSDWVGGLTAGRDWTEHAATEMSAPEVRSWISARVSADGPLCSVMAATLARYSRELREAGEDGGAHEVARNAAWALIGDAAAGHGGLALALSRMKKVLTQSVKGRRGAREVGGEWARIVIRGVEKVAAEGSPDPDDMCALLGSVGGGTAGPSSSTSSGSKSDPRKAGEQGSSAFDFVRDDIGNAQRLVRRLGSDGRYVPELKAWVLYDAETGLWSVDPSHGGIRREAYAVVRGMEEEAKYIEDPKQAAAFSAFVRSSGNLGRVKAMIETAEGLRGVALSSSALDADPRILACSNGALVLGAGGASFRSLRHADLCTFSTSTAYAEGARFDDWDKFLARVLPDPDTARWVQILAGYSLLGANPERILVIAKGPTTSGKTTFSEALRAALGRYASTFSLSLFREKQDEGPRADIVSSLPKRVLFAAEASAEWYLHADALKRFTGGEPVPARLLNSNLLVERVPAFTPWLVTNSYPQVPGADLALWRRIKAAPFLISLDPDEVDIDLRFRLASEEGRAAVLAWLVKGWDMYCSAGLAEPSQLALQMALEAREEMSELDAALASTCEFGAELAAPVTALYEAYRQWVAINGDDRRVLSLTSWGRAMSGKGFEKVRVRLGEDSNKTWVRTGLALRESWSKSHA